MSKMHIFKNIENCFKENQQNQVFQSVSIFTMNERVKQFIITMNIIG